MSMSFQTGPARATSTHKQRHYKTLFLSDIHLGTRGCNAELLLEFLKAHHCDTLYLVGDIIDGWKMRSGIYWPQSHSNVLRRIFTLTKRGTKVVFVTGNHDEFLRRYTPMQLGNLEVVDEATHHSADGRKILVVHGDQFDVITRYHRWIAFLGDAGYTMLLHANTVLNRLRLKYGYGYWSLSAWIKGKVKKAVNFIGDFEQAVAHECRRNRFDGVICGHIHHAEIRSLEDLTYMNCGDWVESCTALAEDDQGNFRVIRWAEERETQRNGDLDVIARFPDGNSGKGGIPIREADAA